MATIFKRIQVKRFDMFKIDDDFCWSHPFVSLPFGQRVTERREESEQLKNRCFKLHKLTVIYKQNPISE